MNTRNNLWKEYREDIKKNADLKEAVEKSNKKLSLLKGRLKKVFPDYFDLYKSDISKVDVKIEDVDAMPNISNQKISKLVSDINELEKYSVTSLSYIDDITFVSEELNSIIDKINKHSRLEKKYVKMSSNEIVMNNTRKIMLGDKMVNLRIAIDGPSGSGKSTVAKMIAKKYNLKYINTGLVYRTIAYYLIENNINLENQLKVSEVINDINIKLLKNEMVDLNGIELKSELRSDIVSQKSSIISSYTFVREFALKIQKEESLIKNVIMDGRDTTFKIMPNADVKIFLDTSPEIRAKRRLEQNKEFGFSIDYDEILLEIKKRDHRDRTREIDPLHQTHDAFLIDSSKLNIQQVTNRVSEIIENKKKELL